MGENHCCSLQSICGGCFFGGMSYEAQLAQKDKQIRNLINEAARDTFTYEGIIGSPRVFCYRNKMEYSFGDEQKNGPLTLGLHKKRSFYDVVNTDHCLLVHNDFNEIVRATRTFFGDLGLTYKDKRTHLGFLRHLLIRRAVHTGELLIDLVTTSQPLIPVMAHSLINDVSLYASRKEEQSAQEVSAQIREKRNVLCADFSATKAQITGNDGNETPEPRIESIAVEAARETSASAACAGVIAPQKEKKKRGRRNSYPVPAPGSLHAADGVCTYPLEETLRDWRDCLLKLAAEGRIEGKLCGILHTTNDSPSDAIKNEGTEVLYGQDSINEELLGLQFKITPFSFFQTNSAGAEVLYTKARSYAADALHEGNTVYDLYSGTGTIAQILAPCVKRVIGVEIIPEAVQAARENAARNGLTNCSFIAGDVLEVLDGISEKPDVIILDPPRDGVNPKALAKIIGYGVERIIYISCKCESLCRDLIPLQKAGYRLEKACAIDQFPWTQNTETVALLSRQKPDEKM